MGNRTDAFLLLSILIIVLAMTIPGIKHSAIVEQDAASHLMDGVFFHDLIQDLPVHDLKDYPFRYYAQYPALGFLFWPPLFAFIEALFFLAGGISITSAILAIGFFSCLLALSLYDMVKFSTSRLFAFFAVLLLLTIQQVSLYLNVVMLDIPMLGMSCLTVALYLRITRASGSESWAQWASLACVASMALYVKQTCFIVLAAIAIDFIVNHRKWLKSPRLWLAVVLFTFLTMPLAVYTIKFGQANIAQSLGKQTNLIMPGYLGMPRWSVQNWLYYAKIICGQIHPILIISAAAGILHSLIDSARFKQALLWIAWILCFYLFFSYFDNKAPRFAMLTYPPLVIIGVEFIHRMLKKLKPYIYIYIYHASLAWPFPSSLA